MSLFQKKNTQKSIPFNSEVLADICFRELQLEETLYVYAQTRNSGLPFTEFYLTTIDQNLT